MKRSQKRKLTWKLKKHSWFFSQLHCIMLRENPAKPFHFVHTEWITLGKSTKQNNSSYQRELSEAALYINKDVHRDNRPAPGYLATTNFQFLLQTELKRHFTVQNRCNPLSQLNIRKCQVLVLYYLRFCLNSSVVKQRGIYNKACLLIDKQISAHVSLFPHYFFLCFSLS